MRKKSEKLEWCLSEIQEFLKKGVQTLKKRWWYCFLLLLSSIYIFIYRYDIYQMTELNAHNFIFILWIVLLALPLFSEIEIGNIKLKKEVEQTRAEVKEAVKELKLQILDIKIANSNSNTFVVNNSSLPPKEELSQLQRDIERDTSDLTSKMTDMDPEVSETNVYLFKVRLSIETRIKKLCNIVGFEGNRPMYAMLQFLSKNDILDRKTVSLIHDIVNIANRGVHGEIVDNDYVEFVKKTGPIIIKDLDDKCDAF